ncbi:agamous-like MADS-box protein AGL80 [Typha latifolia]|uniref:agamous-like MADS-box protein AGL80 n=1 Tax=Typha latifolia TaxID=4733 RepID=UPI003C2D5555
MARKRVKLAWIMNDSTRRTTLKKRKKSLMKKVREISILCGVQACAVVYSPHDSQPEVWPTPPDVAKRILKRFKSKPEFEQTRKMMNQETFLRERVAKMTVQLHRLARDNREAEIRALVLEGLAGRGFEGVGLEDATSVMWLIESKLKEIEKKIEEERKKLAEEERKKVAEQENWVMEMMSPPGPENGHSVLYVEPNSPWHLPFL